MHCVNFVFIPKDENGGKTREGETRVTTIFYGCSQIFRPTSNNFCPAPTPLTHTHKRVIAKVFPLRFAVFKLFSRGIFKLL